MARQQKTLADKLEARTDSSGGPFACWPWTGNSLRTGYGMVGRNTLAHRAAFECANGWLPAVVMHTCDNPRCVNPAHLRAGTASDNMRDMVSKGRHAGGPLSDEQGAYLRALPKGSRLPTDWGFTSAQIRNAAYWARKGRTYAVPRI